jgi:hypothetical protein
MNLLLGILLGFVLAVALRAWADAAPPPAHHVGLPPDSDPAPRTYRDAARPVAKHLVSVAFVYGVQTTLEDRGAPPAKAPEQVRLIERGADRIARVEDLVAELAAQSYADALADVRRALAVHTGLSATEVDEAVRAAVSRYAESRRGDL